MTRYLEVSTEIAQRVRSGDLPPGAMLPAVRAGARERDTTASTISRAYRHLAEGGVITLAARPRARVASDGVIAASRLLEAKRVFRLAGSDDPALQIVLNRAGHTVVPVGTRGSFQGLRALARGNADGAAIHLRHRGGSYNAPFARALLRARRPHLLHLWRREQGLLVAPGNPVGITTPADLARLRVAKREAGTGTRVLLDQMLTAAGVAPHDVAGPELGSHLEIALAVASGITDVGLGVRAVANDLDLDFICVDERVGCPEIGPQIVESLGHRDRRRLPGVTRVPLVGQPYEQDPAAVDGFALLVEVLDHAGHDVVGHVVVDIVGDIDEAESAAQCPLADLGEKFRARKLPRLVVTVSDHPNTSGARSTVIRNFCGLALPDATVEQVN